MLVDEGLVEGLMEVLNGENCECLWLGTNAIHGLTCSLDKYSEKIAVLNGLTKLMSFLGSQDEGILKNVVSSIGNMIYSSEGIRNSAISLNLHSKLSELFSRVSDSLQASIVWVFSNLVRGKSRPPSCVLYTAGALVKSLINTANQGILFEALWLLVFLSGCVEEEIIGNVLPESSVPYIISILSSQTENSFQAAKFLVNVTAHNDIETQILIESGLIRGMCTAWKWGKVSMQLEILLIANNLAAGTYTQLLALLSSPFIDYISEAITSFSPDMRTEASGLLATLGNLCTADHLQTLLDSGILLSISRVLHYQEDQCILSNILFFISRVLSTLNSPEVTSLFEKTGCLDRIEALLLHPNETINKAVQNIMSMYFDGPYDENTLLSPPTHFFVI